MTRFFIIAMVGGMFSQAHAAVYLCNGVYQGLPCQGGKQVDVAEQYQSHPLDVVEPPTVRNSALLDSLRIRTARESRQVVVGMVPSDVRHSWGTPTKINHHFIGGQSSEQWVYRWASGTMQMVYFRDGKVTGWN
ncbi:MAG: hypothetical protein ACRCWL_06750 [Aeromonas sp.]